MQAPPSATTSSATKSFWDTHRYNQKEDLKEALNYLTSCVYGTSNVLREYDYTKLPEYTGWRREYWDRRKIARIEYAHITQKAMTLKENGAVFAVVFKFTRTDGVPKVLVLSLKDGDRSGNWEYGVSGATYVFRVTNTLEAAEGRLIESQLVKPL